MTPAGASLGSRSLPIRPYLERACNSSEVVENLLIQA